MDFSGRRVVVAGGSRGIGRSIALGFAQAGASVSICARGADALEAARREIASRGRPAHAATCDLADAAAIARYIPEAVSALGGIDVLVNNASGFGSTDDEAGWAASFAVDIMAIVRASHAALPFLERAEGAAIVNISSISAMRASARRPVRRGEGGSDPLHHEPGGDVGAQGHPGELRRSRIDRVPGRLVGAAAAGDDPLYARILGQIPFDRLGTPEEVANVALFLASPLAGWVTAQTIAVDGGQLLGS